MNNNISELRKGFAKSYGIPAGKNINWHDFEFIKLNKNKWTE